MKKLDTLEDVPLVTEENDDSRLGARKAKWLNSRKRPAQICLWLFLLECANALLFVGGAIILTRSRRPTPHDLDDYQQLHRFNKSSGYVSDDKWDLQDFLSDAVWDRIYLEYGFVSINEDWASDHGIPVSAPTPETPGEMVYQLDVFHNLHCLSRIRQRILSNETGPHDLHTLHCLNYVRQAVMCNVDLLLHVTHDYEGIDFNQPHTCRDFEAVERWTQDNRWEGFLEWSLENQAGHHSNQHS
ncbi:uncharacterized protein GGS22DRAFT_119165 [Annulohypoxylon maeteangense]|uniref:uncharacterized protein n=1 Tax=Annulohypoxylon maeteangense TaxID=1927788 RepID=UPI00200827FC|nr:uncharacterized protein GGS22DRAFT_119165 [Annulohypoxylon maeteangense]KAI0886930.1 hypothetical protein GGS22DRAFT_119165 [Annulohypoxylon maeteangense]